MAWNLQVQWVRSSRPAEAVLRDVVARAAGFGRPEAWVNVRLSAPDGFDEALLGSGAELGDTYDVLAMALPADVKAPDLPALEVRWWTAPEVARDANTVGNSLFGGSRASDDIIARRVAEEREKFAAGAGGGVVAYVDGTPVAVAAVEVADGVARLWGGGVLESHRGRGIYRALVATRLTYAIEHGATMALSQGNIATSSRILQRLGFVSYGPGALLSTPVGMSECQAVEAQSVSLSAALPPLLLKARTIWSGPSPRAMESDLSVIWFLSWAFGVIRTQSLQPSEV